MNKIKEMFLSARRVRADRTKSAPAERHWQGAARLVHVGNAQQPAIEEVSAEKIEKLYSIWDYAPKLDP